MRSCVVAAFLILFASAMTAPAASNPLSDSRQCLVVVAPDWNSQTGMLRAFERSRGAWKSRGEAIPVVLGKNGLGWGLGLIDLKNEAGPKKKEGDLRVPAGIFHLGPAFGYAPAASARWIKLRYVPLKAETEGIDDPRSRYYNQLVDRSKVAQVDWHSSEQMRRADDLYKWGLFVAHNSTAIPGAGSCIFVHIWRNSSAATVGCTAMSEPNLLRLLRWLDPGAHPVLIQMPQSDYQRLQRPLNLPALP
jgi:L,D-peptidoglycan transpeptidase YkuD (ErfK/YbiS/YcfS/YnhG family)